MNFEVNKAEDDSVEIVYGANRLRAMLQVQNHATVQDITGKLFDVQIVDEKLLVKPATTDKGFTRDSNIRKDPQRQSPPFYRKFAKSKF